MRSWPSWLAIALGVILVVLGLWESSRSGTMGSGMMGNMATGWGWLLLGGAVLLAAGLHALQASYDSWCDCASCMGGGCGCCGDDCDCGDCGECGGHAHGEHGHDHEHGEHSH